MIDFIRVHQAQVTTIVLVTVLFLILFVVNLKFSDKEYKKNFSYVLIALFLIVQSFPVMGLLSSASVNNVPRSTIDRSIVEERAEAAKNGVR